LQTLEVILFLIQLPLMAAGALELMTLMPQAVGRVAAVVRGHLMEAPAVRVTHHQLPHHKVMLVEIRPPIVARVQAVVAVDLVAPGQTGRKVHTKAGMGVLGQRLLFLAHPLPGLEAVAVAYFHRER
jgi:hypothetical protein